MTAPGAGDRAGAGATRLRRRLAGAGLCLLLGLLLLVNLAGPLLRPVHDPDFFWHLATGEWILEHRALPGEYLFAAAPPRTTPAQQRFTMTSYWLSQSLLAAVHGAGGLGAIVALRWALAALLLLLLAARMRGDALVRLGLLTAAAVVLAPYPAERPQYLTFVGAAALLLLLDGIGTAGSAAGARWCAAAIAPLLALWANCHGGFVAGLALLGYTAAAESLKRLLGRFEPLPPQRLRLLLAGAAGGLLASLANPNGWEAVRVALQPGPAEALITEYRSTLDALLVMGETRVLVFWGLLALTVGALLVSWRRADPFTAALSLAAGALAFGRLRFVPLFLVVALPVAARLLSDAQVVRAARAATAALAIAGGAWFAADALPNLGEPSRAAQVDELLLPVEAAEFLRAAGVRSGLFSQYAWGGYLLWRVDGARPFIDGRNADQRHMEVYRRVVGGDATPFHGAPYWKSVLAARRVHATATSYFNPTTGELLGLVEALLADPAWTPVFASPTSVVFLEDVPANRQVIRRSGLPKERLPGVLLEYASGLAAQFPSYVPVRVAAGDLSLRVGDRGGAARWYREALALQPGGGVARERLARVGAAAAGPPASPR